MFALFTAIAAQAFSPSADVSPRTINVDGVRAIYTRRVTADGTLHLKGKFLNQDRRQFHFVVRDGKVRARIDREVFRFSVPVQG